MDFSNIASFFPAIISIVIGSILLAGGIYLFSLIVKALKTYTKSKEVRREKKESQKSLGEVIRKLFGTTSEELLKKTQE